MTGLERLKEIAKSTNDFIISRCIALEIEIAGICDQIEREHLREVDDISGRDADILAWVEEHGGISELKSRLRSGEGAKESTSAYDLLPDCDREAISLAHQVHRMPCAHAWQPSGHEPRHLEPPQRA